MPPPGFGGLELQSWALVEACFTQPMPGPMMQVPPADVQLLAGVDEVHAIGMIPRTRKTKVQRRTRREGVIPSRVAKA
jgi:hypothetical protein